jgi:hypothetical protein
MFEFSVEVSGDIQVKRLFSRFGDKISNIVPALKNIRKRFYDVEKKQFDSQGGFGSGGWEPLSEALLESDFTMLRKNNLTAREDLVQVVGSLCLKPIELERPSFTRARAF